MIKLTPQDAQHIEICIQELEARTCADVLLVLRESSGNYRDVAHLMGAILGFLVLLIAMVAPVEIPEYYLPLPMILIFWITSWLVLHTKLKILFSGPNRKIAQVAKAAHACFYEKKIHQTSLHAGILIYCSLQEKQVELVMDRTAEQALESAKVLEFQDAFSQKACLTNSTERTRGILEVLRTFGVYLGSRLPPTNGEHLNELSNTPDFGEDDSR